MTLITVLIVLAIEFYFRRGAEYRKFNWFKQLQLKLSDHLGDNAWFEGWLGILCILLTPIILLALFVSSFHGSLYYIVLFVTSSVVLFMSLGPKPLADSFESYFEAIERGDKEAAFLSLAKESVLDEVTQGDQLVRNATRCILVESQSRYFGVLFWFIFLGPYGALFYRLTYYYFCICIKNENEEHMGKLSSLIHWVDWIPARLTSLVFLLAGDFVNGFYRVRDYFVDPNADNRQLISETGIAAMGLDMQSSDEAVQENREAFRMVDRTVIVYLVVVAALTPLAFW